MNSISNPVFAVLCSVGAAHAMTDPQPVTLEPNRAPINQAAHIYYNAVTGERVVTLLAEQRDALTQENVPVWAATVSNPCEAFGYGSDFFFVVDEGSDYLPGVDVSLLDYGDTYLDSVVDCIQINWTVSYPDQDLDGDGAMDGVEELAGKWTIWELDNGREAQSCIRTPIMEIMLFNLPGNTPENSGTGAFAEYTMDIDLVAYGSATDLSFELGDSDSNCQSAAFCNHNIANGDRNFDGLPDSDLDGDGLFDWSWSVRFYAPESGFDFDSDSDTGTLPGISSDSIGVSFGAPAGAAVDNGDGTFTWNIDTSITGAGYGAEDRFALYDANTDTYEGGYWFGGFACTGGLQSTGGTGYTPPAMFQFVLYGPRDPDEPNDCLADCNHDGILDFFDITCFITHYQNGGDYNSDGSTNFFDVSAYIMDFDQGCP